MFYFLGRRIEALEQRANSHDTANRTLLEQIMKLTQDMKVMILELNSYFTMSHHDKILIPNRLYITTAAYRGILLLLFFSNLCSSNCDTSGLIFLASTQSTIQYQICTLSCPDFLRRSGVT